MSARPRRIGWLDCAAGASGDMLLGALVDAGVPIDVLRSAIARIATEPVEVHSSSTARHGIGATRVEIVAPVQAEHRTWSDVRALLDKAELPEPVLAVAHDAFGRLALAEARVHRIDPQDVHFHEVGALDAIADVVGVAAGLHALDLDRLHAGVVRLGSGMTRGSHGLVPVPSPATLEVLRAAGAPCEAGPARQEMCTPTGAALLAAVVDGFEPMPRMVPQVIGVGAGARSLDEVPNVLRLVIGAAT